MFCSPILECGVGTFKSTTANKPCSVCPSNSVSISTGAAECTCVTGYYRAPTDDRGDPCTSESRTLHTHILQTTERTCSVQ